MPPFSLLLQIDGDLTDWLIHAAATTDAQRAAMTQLLASRAEFDRRLNFLVAYRLQMAAANLPAETAQLGQAAARMRAVQRTIDDLQDVLATVTTAVAVAAKFASVVA
ncbi:MAG TPA: hypothetical protein VGP07_12690 [Polyangia bacterium]|jgi:DNA anti-recombination protein RmuC